MFNKLDTRSTSRSFVIIMVGAIASGCTPFAYWVGGPDLPLDEVKISETWRVYPPPPGCGDPLIPPQGPHGEPWVDLADASFRLELRGRRLHMVPVKGFPWQFEGNSIELTPVIQIRNPLEFIGRNVTIDGHPHEIRIRRLSEQNQGIDDMLCIRILDPDRGEHGGHAGAGR